MPQLYLDSVENHCVIMVDEIGVIVGMHTVLYYGSVGWSFDRNGTPVHHPSTFVRGALNGDGVGLKMNV